MTDIRYGCPLCGWYHDEPKILPSEIMAAAAQGVRTQQVEARLAAHLTTHTTQEWLTLVGRLEFRLQRYGRHLEVCQRMAQMPMKSGSTYAYPTDWDAWRARQACTCGWEEPGAEAPAIEVEVVA